MTNTQNPKKTLLAVLAHTDDESFGMGGTLALYASQGVDVHLVCATKGEAGEVAPEFMQGYDSIADVRMAELNCAGENLDLSAEYDFITAFDAIHDQAQPAKVLQGIANALRSEGTFLMVDIAASSNVAEHLDHVIGPLMYTVSCMDSMTMSLALDGEGLGAMWGEQKARQMLAEAGFAQVSFEWIESDIFNYYYIASKI